MFVDTVAMAMSVTVVVMVMSIPMMMVVMPVVVIMCVIVVMIMRAQIFLIIWVAIFGMVVMNIHFALCQPVLERGHQVFGFSQRTLAGFFDPFDKGVDDVILVFEVFGFEVFNFWVRGGHAVHIAFDPFDQLTGKEEERRHNDAFEAKF